LKLKTNLIEIEIHNMKKILTLIFTIIVIKSFGQNLTCNDLKKGTFILTTDKFPNVEWKIIRNGVEQTEMPIKIPKEYIELGFPTDTLYSKIKWIDECKYHMIYDEEKRKLDESQKMLNDSGGILTELIRIENRCFYYVSTMIINGQKQVIEGKLCKE